MEGVEVSWEEAAAEVALMALPSTPMEVATLATEEPTMASQGLILGMATLMQGLTAMLGLMGLRGMGQTLGQVRGGISQQAMLEDPPQGR